MMNRQRYPLILALVVAGIIFRQPLLAISGLLLLLIIAIRDIWLKYCLHDVRYQRKLSEEKVLFGEDITLSLTVENGKLLPLPWLEVEDALPRALPIEGHTSHWAMRGDQVRLDCLFSPRWYERVTRQYTMHCLARGVHSFGPVTLRSGDVFGFTTREQALDNRQYVLVYPLVVPLTRFGLPSRHPFGDRKAPRRILEDPSRVIGVRDYQYGDSLRRVHWKATARTLQMQSKVYEPTSTYTLILFLNTGARFDAHYGIHPELQELSICAAASVTGWGIDQGYAVGLYANTIMYMPEGEAGQIDQTQDLEATVAAQLSRRRIHLPPSSSEEQRKRIMEVLARIQGYFASSLEELIQVERSRLPAGATVAVITSTMSEQLMDVLKKVRQGGHAVAVLFTGDAPVTYKMAGIPFYHLGGEQTWKDLVASFGPASDKVVDGSAPLAVVPDREKVTAGLNL